MNRNSRYDRLTNPLAALAALGLVLAGAANAQVPVDADGNPISPLDGGVKVENPLGSDGVLQSAAELEALVGPIALYPDDLLAIVLPASTYPLEIVQAARFLEQVESNPGLKPDPEWDESVTALLNYPEVVKLMDEDIDWTWKLGEAVVAQQADVIAAVESFRDRAYAAGNLKSDEYQNVTVEDGVIEIEPVSDDIIYVPYYEPERVVVYSPRPVYYYYPRPYPVYYYPYPAGHYFTSQFFWGVTTAFTIGWSTDHLHVYHPSYLGHPYYGYTYYGSYWRRPSINVYNTYYVNNHVSVSRDHYRSGDYWRPRHRGGARPGYHESRDTYYSDRNREQLSNSYRDQRTSGLAYTSTSQQRPAAGVDRSTPRTAGTSSRSNDRRVADSRRSNRGSDTLRSPSAATARPEIEFRPRSDQAQSGSTARRLERAANDTSARPATRGTGSTSGRATNRNAAATSNRPADRASANSGGGNDAIRFRSRETSGARNTVAQASGRTTAAPTRNRNRATVTASERSTAVGNVSRGSASTPAPSARNRATAAPSAVQSRPATARSQPAATQAYRAPASRPASSPARAERRSADRASTRSSGSSGESKRSGNSSASGRRERR